MSPPPPNVLQDDPDGADAARQRLAPKKGFARLLSRPSNIKLSAPLRRSSSAVGLDHNAHDDVLPITLDSTALISQEDSPDHDTYQWAVLYENQRGITAFSIPYYSSLSLLPADPAPFTLPDPSLDPSHHPPVSPNTYPLPDGNWLWVSRAWMIDMRSDTGQVQHDGFEYNWIFRRHNWKSHVGPMNIAGYVRRRRWIRLMVRPAKSENGTAISSASSTPLPLSFTPRHSPSSSIPPSLMSGLTDLTAHSSIYGHVHPNEVWSGTNPDEDWERCRRLMKHFHFGRDGRKLELWRLWLGFHRNELHDIDISEKARGKRKQWTEDDELMPSEAAAAAKLLLSKDTVTVAPPEYIIPVLEKYAQPILQLFIFPDSRAQFIKLLGQAGLLISLNLSPDSGMTELHFWSYASGLADLPGSEEVILKSPLAKQVFCRCRGEGKGDDGPKPEREGEGKLAQTA